MTALATLNPIPQYFDTDGSPLSGGKIYFGQVGQNPETNPITVYWDAAATQPAAQPVRTLNGYTARAGSPALVFASQSYSITVRDRRGRLVFTAPNSADFGNASTLLDIVTGLGSTTDPARGAGQIGFNPKLNYAVGTLGYSEKATVHLKQFSDFVGDGVADDTAAVQAALNFMSTMRGKGVLNAEGCLIRLTSRVIIPQWVLFKGAPWLPDPSNGAQLFTTCLIIDWGSGQNEHAVEVSHSSGIDGFTFWYPGQAAKTASAPVEFGFAISTDPSTTSVKDNILVRNITLYNAYRGIRLNYAGRFRVEDIQGDPLFLGFTADQCLDACYMDRVHFWDFYTQGDVLETWVAANGTGFEFRRVDQLFGNKLFAWNRNINFHARDQAWLNLTDILADRGNFNFIVEAANQVTVTGFVFIPNANTKPAIWGRSIGESARFSNGRITNAGAVGVQIDDGAVYQFDNVDFDCMHSCVVNRSLTTEVRISDTCRWNVPPMGAYNTFVNGERFPKLDLSIALGAATPSGAMTTITGGFRAPLSTLTNSLVDWDLTLIGQRCGLYILEFDYAINGTPVPTTWYFQFRVQNDVGTLITADFAPLSPLILNVGTSTKVRIPFHINHARNKTIARFQIVPTVVVAGASVDITNILLYEQDSKYLTDAQISNAFRSGLCLDPYGKGQTVSAKGKARRIVTEPEAGIGRPGATPTSGQWFQGDEVLLDAPTAGASPGVVCTGGGIFGTGGPPVFKAQASLAP